jgi:S-ribosylhomocysteine lyase LuxS involved in autoinducer biosynthesis
MSVLKSAWAKTKGKKEFEAGRRSMKAEVPNSVRQQNLKESVSYNLRLLLDNLDLIDTRRLEAIEHVISVELRERDERN